MILDEYSELKWQAGIKKKYIDLGYEFTKMGDTFKVRVEDLSKGSHSIVHVLCDVCGIVDKYLSYKVYNKNIKSCGFYACSNKCATIKNDETNLKLYGTTNPNELDFIKEKTIKTNLEKYGTKFISQNEDIKNKRNETNLKRYGSISPFGNDEIFNKGIKTNLEKFGVPFYSMTEEFKEKFKETMLGKYGVENPMQDEEVKNKSKITNLEKYGFESPMQNEEVKNRFKEAFIKIYGVINPNQVEEFRKKAIDTMMNNYGVSYTFQSPEIREKSRKTNLENLGVEFPMQNENVKNKSKITNLERYGFEFASQNKEVREKIKQTNLERYGFENPMQNSEIVKKVIETSIERYGEIWRSHIPRYKPASIIFLDMISELLEIKIQHALNGREKKFHRYWVDGYIEKFNICLEWNEPAHYGKQRRIKDFKRYRYIYENFGCLFYEIDEKEFLKNPEANILKIVEDINKLINDSSTPNNC